MESFDDPKIKILKCLNKDYYIIGITFLFNYFLIAL